MEQCLSMLHPERLLARKSCKEQWKNVASLSNAYLAFSGKAPTIDRATMSVNLQNIMFTNENTRKATTIQFEDEMIYAKKFCIPTYKHILRIAITTPAP